MDANIINITIWWRQAVEIIIFAFIFYYSFQFLKGTRAYQVLKGMIILLLIYVIAKYLELSVIVFILGKIFGVAVLTIVILFHPEIRRILATIGRTNIDYHTHGNEDIVDILTETVSILTEKYIGALIVIARQNSLQSYIDTGVLTDSIINVELLVSIFIQKTPLHDGAVIIDGSRIVAASCLLPLSQRSSFSHSLGTRHRAAIGLSEETDAVVLIVSEETGNISIASAGKISLDVDMNTLKKFLTDIFHIEEQKKTNIIKKILQKIFK